MEGGQEQRQTSQYRGTFGRERAGGGQYQRRGAQRTHQERRLQHEQYGHGRQVLATGRQPLKRPPEAARDSHRRFIRIRNEKPGEGYAGKGGSARGDVAFSRARWADERSGEPGESRRR